MNTHIFGLFIVKSSALIITLSAVIPAHRIHNNLPTAQQLKNIYFEAIFSTAFNFALHLNSILECF